MLFYYISYEVIIYIEGAVAYRPVGVDAPIGGARIINTAGRQPCSGVSETGAINRACALPSEGCPGSAPLDRASASILSDCISGISAGLRSGFPLSM